jgi:phenylacetate-CoA ligase
MRGSYNTFTMGLRKSILLKKGLRTDRIWTKKFLYREPFWRIPLWMDMFALFKSQYWPREEIESMQWERIRELVRDAANVPLWKDTFEKLHIDPVHISPEDFRKLPVVSKKTFVGKERAYFTDERYMANAYSDFTSGSTGQPLNFFTDWLVELRSYAVCERVFYTVTGDVRYPVFSLRAKYKTGFIFRKRVLFYVPGFNGVRYRLPDLIAITKKFTRGFILYGFTSSIIETARLIKESGEKLHVRAVVTTGEAIRDTDKALIKKVFNADFFLTYATRELGWIGYECLHHNLHMCEEYAYFEILDENNAPVEDGKEGRVIVTSLDNRAMPFIRYEIGDRGVISPALCPCGRTLKTLKLIGRQTEFIELADKRVASLLDISASFDNLSDAVRRYQIVQKEPLLFLIKVVAGPEFDNARETLELRLVQLLHPQARIEWEQVESIPESKSGKAVYFVREL